MLTDKTYFDIPDHVHSREVDGETIILDMERGVYCGLDGVGAHFFNLIKKKQSIHDAIDILFSEYDVKRPVLEEDIRQLIDELLSKSLIQVSAL